MNQIQKTCAASGQPFVITDEDRKVFEMFNVPEPTLCPDERHRRRTSFRNELNFYKRKCDKTGKDIISSYSTDKPYTIYSSDVWWGDECDGTEYGRDFDFSRPFFEQFEELCREVPLPASTTFKSINSEFTNFTVDSQNCYYSARVGNSEDILYSYLAIKSTGCIDCYNVSHSQYCYDCVDCWSCYECFYCQLCKNTNNSWFCYDCIGCSDCFGCVGLRNKKFYFFNQKCTEEEYRQKVAQYNLGSRQVVEYLENEFFRKYLPSRPQRATYTLNSENAIGNYIEESKNIFHGFDIEKTEDARYAWGIEFAKDAYDVDFIYYGERTYEQISNSRSQNVRFSFGIFESHNIDYSMYLFNNCQDCFGCVALKRKKYCILNKQYSKEEYEALVPRIIEHMKSTGEWGEFFPISLSTYAYNESVAGKYFPLTKEEALAKGYKWKDTEEKEYSKPTIQTPDDIKDVDESICKELLACRETGRNYKVTPQELKFYKQYGLPLPQKHFLERHKERLTLRNPRKLWERTCAKTGKNILTPFSPDRPEIVYCEEAYMETLN